jgi:hypothetical protein
MADEITPPGPLQEASTDDLLKELRERMDAFVFMGMREMSEEREDVVHDWKGGGPTCVGLTVMLQGQIEDEWRSTHGAFVEEDPE